VSRCDYNNCNCEPRKQRDQKLVEDHWAYSEGLLRLAGVGKAHLAIVGYVYKQAMKHGMKHAREETQ